MIALIVGGAPSVWSELEEAKALVAGREHLIVATNHSGRLYEGDIDAWVTLHPELFEPWRKERAAKDLNEDYRALVYPRRQRPHGTEPWPQRWYGSSGLYGAQVALEALDCRGVILCGVPMLEEAGHVTGLATWPGVEKYRPGFLEAKAEGAPIRSMSGWTADLFGRPDEEWLASLGLGLAQTKQRIRRAPEATMRIRMLTTHNFVPPEERRMAVKYLDGQEYTVKRAWGEAMVAEKVAKEVKAPPKPETDA